jgi:hypothetical protein
MAQTCSRCGTAASDDAYFCPHCSNRLAGPSFAVPLAVEPARRSRFPFVLLGLGLCLIVGVVAALVYIQVGQINHDIGAALNATSPPAYVSNPTSAPDSIVFGTSVDSDAMTVADPATTFSTTDMVGWVAILSGKIGGASVTVTLASVSSGGSETTITSAPMSVSNPDANEFAHAPDNYLGSLGAGTYTLRYIRVSDGTILAAGTVTITP